jgi:hypothetical protein
MNSKSDIVIQLNFTSGFGDLYCAMVDILNIALRCKELKLNLDLIYNFDRNYYFYDDNNVDILSFFDTSSFTNFENVIKSRAATSLEGFKHIFTPHLSRNPLQGGLHLWDLFLNSNKLDFESDVMSTISCHAMNNFGDLSRIKIIPEFPQRIKDLGLKDTQLTGIHFRTNDSSESMDIVNNNLSKINKIIENNKTYIVSNSKNIRNYFINYNHSNILINKPRHENVGYHFYAYKSNSKDNKQLIENLEDTIAEMYNLSHCKKVYVTTEWSRPSNFLFYSKIKTPDIEFAIL